MSLNEKLDALDSLHAAATQGEWEASLHFLHTFEDIGLYGTTYARLGNGEHEIVGYFPVADLKQCVALHNAYPELAAELRRLTEEVEVQDRMLAAIYATVERAIGRGGWHSQMEAVEDLAKRYAEAREDSVRKQFLCEQGCYMEHDIDGERCWLVWPIGRDREGGIEKQVGLYNSHNAAIDAAMEGK